MRQFGTLVKNPMHRPGGYGYSPCTYCAKLYTSMGISRHWDKCKENPKNKEAK